MKKYNYTDYLEYDQDPDVRRDKADYDEILDKTFDRWLVLKEGASLKNAILALAEEAETNSRFYGRSAIRVLSDEAVAELGEEKEALFQLCEKNCFTVIRKDWPEFYNYLDGHRYYIKEESGYGAVDDAADYLFLWWKKIPTPEEMKEKRRRQIYLDRQWELKRGKAACKKYCLNNMEQAEQMVERVRAIMEELASTEPEQTFSEKVDIRYQSFLEKRQKMERYQKEIADAKAYLLSPDELEDNAK